MDKELKIRTAKVWKAFWGQKIILKSKMHLKIKIRIFKSCVIPTLTYGAQTRAPTKTSVRKLKSTQNSMLRSILNIKRQDKIKISEIKTRTKIRDIGCY